MKIEIHKFPNPTERVRIAKVKKFVDLYELRQRGVLGLHKIIEDQYKKQKDLVYLAHALPARISEFYGDFVQGDEEKLIIAPPQNTTDKKIVDFIDDVVFDNDLKELVYDMGVDQSEFGFIALHTWKDDAEKIRIDLIPEDQYFPQSDGSVIIATYKKDDTDILKSWFMLTQHYKIENEKVIIEREAWKTDTDGVAVESITLEVMAKVMGRDKIEDKTTLEVDVIPIVQVNNGKKMRDGFGKSDYVDILPQLAELNERTTHISTQLLKNMDAKIVLPKAQGMTDEDNKIKPFDHILLEGKEHIQGYYITNDNPLMDSTFEHIMFQLKMISFLSSVPMNELLKSAMPERVEALRIQLFSAVRRTNTKRSKIKRGLKDILRIGAKLKGIDIDKDPVIEMSDVLPVDEMVVADTEDTKIRAGISSRKSSMKRVENYSDSEAEAEREQIHKEDALIGVNPENPPKL